MMKTRALMALAAVAMFAGAANADVIGFENFDGGAINLAGTSNVFDFGNGGGTGGDVFGRVSALGTGGTGMPYDVGDDSVASVGGSAYPSDSLGIAGQYTTAFFAMNDMDAVGVNDAVWSFDISSAASIDSITMSIAAMGDFEDSSNDGFLVEAQIDGAGYQEIFKGRTNEAIDKTYRALDGGYVATLSDPLELYIDGVKTGTTLDKCDPATGEFDLFSSTLFAGLSGSTMDIRVSWTGAPSGSEPMGLDNVTINGTVVPEPATLVFLALGGLVLIHRRR